LAINVFKRSKNFLLVEKSSLQLKLRKKQRMLNLRRLKTELKNQSKEKIKTKGTMNQSIFKSIDA
jgi:hypothetical protein